MHVVRLLTFATISPSSLLETLATPGWMMSTIFPTRKKHKRTRALRRAGSAYVSYKIKETKRTTLNTPQEVTTSGTGAKKVHKYGYLVRQRRRLACESTRDGQHTSRRFFDSVQVQEQNHTINGALLQPLLYLTKNSQLGNVRVDYTLRW